MYGGPEFVALRKIYFLVAVSVVVSSFTGCVAGSCLSYGHSCWGAHGKRSGPLDRHIEDASASWTESRRLLQPSGYYPIGDESSGSPSLLLSRLLRHQEPSSQQRLMRSMTAGRQFEQQVPPVPPLMIIDGEDLPDAAPFSKRSPPIGKLVDDTNMREVVKGDPKITSQFLSNDMVNLRPKDSPIKSNQAMTLGLYKLLKNIDSRIDGANK